MTSTTETSQPSVRLAGEDDDRSIDGYELFSARRALELLKRRLGRDGLLDLLREEIAAGDAFLHEHVTRSAGQEASGTTVLAAQGISALEFAGWLAVAFGREDVLMAAHPEHYSIHAAPGTGVNIVETLGDQVCSFFMREWDDSVVTDPQPPAGPGGGGGPVRRSRMALADGTVVGSISTAFVDEPGGFSAHLSVTLPATAGPEVQQHLEHFAVEFRSWILRAATELRAAAATS